MLSQLVDHGHWPLSLSHDRRADIQIIWITPPRFRAVNPSSDRNRDAKRFGHGVRREPRCWHQQRLRTTHIGTNYLLSRCPERPSNLVASGFLPTPSTANPASRVFAIQGAPSFTSQSSVRQRKLPCG